MIPVRSDRYTIEYWNNKEQKIVKFIPRLAIERDVERWEKENGEDLNAFAEFYPSGVCRIVSTAGCPQGSTKIEEKDRTCYKFSSKSRNRFYKKLLSIRPDDHDFYFATVTIPNNKHAKINLENYKKAVHTFLQRLSRYHLDTFAKTEFHKSGIPHLHLIIVSEPDLSLIYDKVLKSKIKVYPHDETKKSFIRALVLSLWLDILGTYFINFNSRFNNRLFWACCSASVQCDIVNDFSKAVYYISKYTCKNDDYQNRIPYPFVGLRFVHKSLKNFGKKLYSEKKVVYKISDTLFHQLRLKTIDDIKMDCLEQKKPYKGGILNGFFFKSYSELADKLSNSDFASPAFVNYKIPY